MSDEAKTQLGHKAEASRSGATAIGHRSKADGEWATALGAGAKAKAYSSVAIGAGSIADEPRTVSFGHSAGGGLFARRLVNVKAGKSRTDAATFGQLQELRVDLELMLRSKADAYELVPHETASQPAPHSQVTKRQALRIIRLLSAIEGWAFGLAEDLPGHLGKRLQEAVADLETAVLNGGGQFEVLTAQLEQLTDILTRTANALKGPPAELTEHSWHDLPEVAKKLKEENK